MGLDVGYLLALNAKRYIAYAIGTVSKIEMRDGLSDVGIPESNAGLIELTTPSPRKKTKTIRAIFQKNG